jgi:hypothetical protein
MGKATISATDTEFFPQVFSPSETSAKGSSKLSFTTE